MSVRSHVRHTIGELNSSTFALPPLESSPDIIRWFLFTWTLAPCMENLPRDIIVTCTQCARTWKDGWPIRTGNYKRHFWVHHEVRMLHLRSEALEAVKKGKPWEQTILSSKLFTEPQRRARDTGLVNPFEENHSTSSNEALSVKKTRSYLLFDEKECRSLLLELVIAKNLPFNFVDSEEFHKFVRTLRYDAPTLTRHTMRADLDILFDQTVSLLKLRLDEHKGRFALTVDEWNSGNNYDFFAITLHYFNDTFELKNYTIGFEVLDEYLSYTGDVLYECFINVLKEYEIETRIISITRDNASPISALVKRFSREDNERNNGLGFVGDIRCIGHVLNLATNVFLRFSFFKTSTSIRFAKTIEEMKVKHPTFARIKRKMKALPKTIRSITFGTRTSKFLTNCFKKLTKKRKSGNGSRLGPEVVKKDNNTRWLSTYEMIKRFLYFRPEITELLELAKERGDIDQCKLAAYEVSDDQWEVLGDIKEILATFEDPTLDLQGLKYSTISLTIPHVYGVLKELDVVLFTPDSNNKDLKKRNPYLARGVREAQRKILDYYPIYDDNINSLKTLYLATALDPRLKLGVFEDLGFSDTIIAEIKSHFRDVYNNYRLEHDWSEEASQDCSETMETDEEALTQGSSPVKGFKSNLFVRQDATRNDLDEVDIYFSERRERRKSSLTNFYQSRQMSFPIIYRMARDYLAIPAMSSAAEALFSEVGNIVTKSRNRLGLDSIKKLTICKKNGLGDNKKREETRKERYEDQQSTNEEPRDPFITLDDRNNLDESRL